MSIDDTPSTLIAPATILQDRYRVVRQLGRGGMGAVYEAIDLRLGHTVALKQSLSNDAPVLKQFEREARLLAHLNHPVLPRVSDYFTDAARAFLVMQFVAGDDLATLLAQAPGPMPRQTVVAWADQLLDAIIYLHTHDRQIIHRDIKPHNLKVTPAGKIALLDFGLAKPQRRIEGETHTSGIYGYSPRYAPLEQIHDTSIGPQSDIYALGATLYHLLTGIKPVDAVTRATAIVNSQPSPLTPAHESNPTVGLELSLIIARAMAPDAGERFATANEFREALRRLGRIDDFAGPAAVGQEEFGSYLTREPSRLHIRVMAAIMIMLLASFAVFCHYYRWRMPDSLPLPPVSLPAAHGPLDQSQIGGAGTTRQHEKKARAKKRSDGLRKAG
ncbi:MAG TPA: serine/threonine-protein kinase [Pyrinomonadaceae bacterium]|nr:serine/threonine-protein kinase [Pyrinomonadaceae bacterium]